MRSPCYMTGERAAELLQETESTIGTGVFLWGGPWILREGG